MQFVLMIVSTGISQIFKQKQIFVIKWSFVISNFPIHNFYIKIKNVTTDMDIAIMLENIHSKFEPMKRSLSRNGNTEIN